MRDMTDTQHAAIGQCQKFLKWEVSIKLRVNFAIAFQENLNVNVKKILSSVLLQNDCEIGIFYDQYSFGFRVGSNDIIVVRFDGNKMVDKNFDEMVSFSICFYSDGISAEII